MQPITLANDIAFGPYFPCDLYLSCYAIDNHPCFFLLDSENGEPIAVLTVNLDGLEHYPNHCAIDTNNLSHYLCDIDNILAEFAEPTEYTLTSGYCAYPLYQLTERTIALFQSRFTLDEYTDNPD